MTRRTYVYDADADAMVQVRGPGTNYYEPASGLQIIRDIEPYRAIGADVACDGKRPVVGGRRQHREYLARNSYVEVGNDAPVSGSRPDFGGREMRAERVADIRRALGHPGGVNDRR